MFGAVAAAFAVETALDHCSTCGRCPAIRGIGCMAETIPSVGARRFWRAFRFRRRSSLSSPISYSTISPWSVALFAIPAVAHSASSPLPPAAGDGRSARVGKRATREAQTCRSRQRLSRPWMHEIATRPATRLRLRSTLATSLAGWGCPSKSRSSCTSAGSFTTSGRSASPRASRKARCASSRGTAADGAASESSVSASSETLRTTQRSPRSSGTTMSASMETDTRIVSKPTRFRCCRESSPSLMHTTR